MGARVGLDPASLLAAPLDVLVVGGGIVGAGVARDAALRKLRVACIDQHDFAFGTSSRSTRLLHGGLRYLAQGHVMLVREASREKTLLHRLAPHLAQPLAFILPARKGDTRPRWQLRIGVWLYDCLCGKANLGDSRALSLEEVRRVLPQLRHDGVTGAVRYFDGLTNDSRLVLDTLRSAESAGAVLCNYFGLTGARREGGLWHCTLRDTLSGVQMTCAARCVVNATGPWSDRMPIHATRLRLTKGVHLVVDAGCLSTPDAVVVTEGSRILFVIPWGRRLVLGTTDTDYDGDPADVRCDEADIEYVLAAVGRWFPQASITRQHVLSTWAGLRPLVRQADGSPSDVSRRHEITAAAEGWFDISGGKLTTYRLMAEQATDKVCRTLGIRAGCETSQRPLLSAEHRMDVTGILPPALERGIVEHYCRNEFAVHLDDVMTRRTSWRYYLDNPAGAAEQVSRWMAELLRWDEPTRLAELRRYEQADATCRPEA